jgi:hypothetical protein
MAIKLDATIQQGLVSFAEHHKNFSFIIARNVSEVTIQNKR